MKAKAQIVSERRESYTGKRDKVEQVIVSCLDLDPTHAMLNTFDLILGEEETAKHAGKLQGKHVELGIRNFEPSFGNRLRARTIPWRGAETLASLPDAWKGVRNFRTPGGEQEFITIVEAGVYRLAFRSNKPEAESFTNFVASEILPTIRKTGKYEVKANLDFSDPLTAAQLYIEAETGRRTGLAGEPLDVLLAL